MLRTLGFVVLILAAVIFAAPAHAAPVYFTTVMNGPSEAPPNTSPGSGVSVVTFDPDTGLMRITATFSGLQGTVTAAHIHGPIPLPPAPPVAGVATPVPTFPGFPSGVTSGSYDMTFDMNLASSYNPAFITANGGTVAGARTAFFNAMSSGRAYLNIHSTVYGGGEIRGFFARVTSTPEPVSLLTFGAVIGVVGLVRARRRVG
jgi:hypothetical protein